MIIITTIISNNDNDNNDNDNDNNNNNNDYNNKKMVLFEGLLAC